MRMEITKEQRQILINSMRSIGLLALEKDLPRAARSLLLSTYIALQKVLRELHLSKPIAKDGFLTKEGVEHQYSVDNSDQWESQK
jgi:hypothetical protein